MYQVQRPARTESIRIRTLNYHVRLWGEARSDAAPLVLLHGWMDVGASYQFVVDAFGAAFAQGRQIIAPDWRGFGLSLPPSPCDSYHFADYLADLDQLLDHYAAGRSVDLVGHSMGGNVAMMYAGARPARIRRLVNLEGQWERGEMELTHYDSADGVALRLMKTNPRLAGDKATWLARHWAREGRDGRWHILGEAAHKVASAQLYRVDEALALHASITAPVLSVEASDDSLSRWWKGCYTLAEYRERLPTCATRARPWCRTPATCCTTTSRRQWRR
jgi:pimeloyl-ACP methyl ester carboxylesterase